MVKDLASVWKKSYISKKALYFEGLFQIPSEINLREVVNPVRK